MCLGHLGEKVVEVLGDGSEFGLEVVYSFDGPELRGTAGAIRRALPLLGPAFFVLYGDSYLECDYAAVQEAYRERGNVGAHDCLSQRGQWDKSNVEFIGGRILAYDKVTQTPAMQYIDYGLGILDQRALESVRGKRPVRSGHGLSGNASAGRARGVRGHGAVLRDWLGSGARRDEAPPGGSRLGLTGAGRRRRR